MSDAAHSADQFRAVMGISLFGMLATVFTWVLITSLSRTIVTPVLRAYVVPNAAMERLTVQLRGNQTLDLGQFIAELIQWAAVMVVLYMVWRTRRHFSAMRS